MFMMPLHPLDRVASQTLCEGREAIILADELGSLDAFVESIDAILAIWEGETPYDIDLPSNRFKVT